MHAPALALTAARPRACTHVVPDAGGGGAVAKESIKNPGWALRYVQGGYVTTTTQRGPQAGLTPQNSPLPGEDQSRKSGILRDVLREGIQGFLGAISGTWVEFLGVAQGDPPRGPSGLWWWTARISP